MILPSQMTPMRVALFFLLAATTIAWAEDPLRDAYAGFFHVGVAINRSQSESRDARDDEIITSEFDSVSPENDLKWKFVHPKVGIYDFAPSDAYVAFGEKHHMFVIGHALVWHEAAPDWIFQDEHGKPLSRDLLLQRLRDHIHTVVGRYKGRIRGWDVVNEALAEDGSLRNTLWRKIIGDDYIEKAFQYAHEADPNAELYYNDYLLENPQKRRGALALIERLRAKGIRVDAVGLQGHYSLDWPSPADLEAAIADFARVGMKVNITELDIDVLPRAQKRAGSADVKANALLTAELDPFPEGLPAGVQHALAKRYADVFHVLLQHRADVTRVTFWGVTDADSWLNNWPVKGRTNYPLLFDRQGRPKPALDDVIKAAQQFRAEHSRSH